MKGCRVGLRVVSRSPFLSLPLSLSLSLPLSLFVYALGRTRKGPSTHAPPLSAHAKPCHVIMPPTTELASIAATTTTTTAASTATPTPIPQLYLHRPRAGADVPASIQRLREVEQQPFPVVCQGLVVC